MEEIKLPRAWWFLAHGQFGELNELKMSLERWVKTKTRVYISLYLVSKGGLFYKLQNQCLLGNLLCFINYFRHKDMEKKIS